MSAFQQTLDASGDTISQIYQRLHLESGPLLFLDIFIVVIFTYVTYRLVSGTRAVRIIVGLFLIEALVTLARYSNLQILNWLLGKVFVVFLFAIPVIFQPELRRALGKIGERGIPRSYLRLRPQSFDSVNEVILGVRQLKEGQLGALIVIKGVSGLDEFVETGTRVDSVVSAKLIESIFHQRSPLHDGAMIIEGDRILAAGCVYNAHIPESARMTGMGLRHRAAIGFSLESDATVIVLSEETGKISLVRDGQLRPVSLKQLEKELIEPLEFETNGFRGALRRARAAAAPKAAAKTPRPKVAKKKTTKRSKTGAGR
jgi:diadenylate cyclase